VNYAKVNKQAFEKYKLPEEILGDWRRRNTNNIARARKV
jgi:hypothetical protein